MFHSVVENDINPYSKLVSPLSASVEWRNSHQSPHEMWSMVLRKEFKGVEKYLFFFYVHHW